LDKANDDRQFVTAYYLAGPNGALDQPLYLDRYDRDTRTWLSKRLESTGDPGFETWCLGAVLEIHSFGEYLLVDTHINPSAGCTLVVDRNLRLRTSLYGWFIAGLGAERIIYHRSEIHFFPVHELAIAMYDLHSGEDVTLFPQKPDPPIRAQLIGRLKAFFASHQAWCREHNHPCNAEQIDSELASEVAANPATDALAFLVSYETQVYQASEVQIPDGPKRVLYVYRHVGGREREFREIPIEAQNSPERQQDLGKFLTPERLDEIFH
jgi:hypothetical protein